MLKSGLLILAAAVFFGAQAQAADYYVNSLSQLQTQASKALPGDVIHMAPGTYTLTTSNYQGLLFSKSGTASSRIKFVSDTKWAAKLVINSTNVDSTDSNPACITAVRITGSYVDLQGFDISGTCSNGVLDAGSYSRVIGNRVHDILAACNGNGGSGINDSNYYAQGNDIIGNIVARVRPSPNCSSQGHGAGIYHSHKGGHVMNNIVFDNGKNGIQLWHAATNVVIANNLSFNNNWAGIEVGAGDAPGGVTDNYTDVVNNIALYNGTYGIYEYGATGTANRYIDNIVYGNRNSGLRLLTGTASGTITNVAPTSLFANWQLNGTGDYRLTSTSPAVDRGTAQYAPAYDFNNYPRPYGGAFDIGPFEYHPTSP